MADPLPPQPYERKDHILPKGRWQAGKNPEGRRLAISVRPEIINLGAALERTL